MPLAIRAFLGLLLALLPVAVVQILLESEARQERAAQVGEEARRLVRLVARQQVSIVEGARQTLSAIAAHEAVRAGGGGADCEGFLARVVNASPRYGAALVLDRDGRPVCASGAAMPGEPLGERPYIRRALAGSAFELGEYDAGGRTGAPALPLAMPVRDEAGRIVGVAVLALSLGWLNEDLLRLDLPHGAASAIADRTGVLLARRPDPERFVGTPMPEFAMALLRSGTAGTIDRAALDGVRRIAAYLPLHEAPEGLFITVGLDVDGALADSVAAERRSTLMIVGSLLLTFTVALLGFHGAVESPVRRMLETAQRWSRQDWRARVGPIRGGGEMRRLAAAFDEMAGAIEAREAARASATSRMQAVLAVAPQIVLTADPNGRVDWANAFWESATGRPAEAARGEGWLEAVTYADRHDAAQAWEAAVAGARLGGEAGFHRDLRLDGPGEGAPRWFALRGAAQRDAGGAVTAWLVVGVDIHELREAQAEAAQAVARLSATYETAPVGLCLMDEELRILAINAMLAATNGLPPEAHIGRRLEEVAPHVAPTLVPLLRELLRTGGAVEELEVRGEVGGEERVWLCNYRPVRDAAGGVRGVSGAVIDITARKRVEEAERLLSREVDHRAQNVLSVVRGLIRLSAADAPDSVPELVESLEGRVAALSRAHNVLSRERWLAADLGQIVEQEMAAHPNRAWIEGPRVRLTAEAAQPLTLVLHELATNAVKYGALSDPAGHVEVAWRRQAEGLVLAWRERGGPRLAGPPPRTGFGSLLIDANVRAPLGGSVERRWEPEGLVCEITLGAGAVAVAAAPPGQPLSGRQVMVAIDDPATALAVTGALQAMGCDVLGPAATPEEALALLDAAGGVDAALLAPLLGGRSMQPVRDLLERRAIAILGVGPAALVEEVFGPTRALEPPVTVPALRAALSGALAA